MTNPQTVEIKRLLKEIDKTKKPQEMKEIRDKILENLDKKTETIKQLIRERK
ncbi:MAG: hypothetical protein AB1414_19115 [bacterium]